MHSEVASRWAEIGGLRVHGRFGAGPAGSPTVVLVHGSVSSSYLMPTADALRPYCSVALIDLPGFGPSERPRPVPDVPGFADVAAAWMRHHGLEGATLAGHSTGCQTAVEVVARHPGLASGAVLVGPTGDPTVTRLSQLAGRWLRCLPETPLSLNPVLVRESLALGPAFSMAVARRYVAHPILDRLEELAIPTLVVRGERDHIAPAAWVATMVARLPQAHREVIAGHSHTVNWSAPGQLAGLVSGFAAGRGG